MPNYSSYDEQQLLASLAKDDTLAFDEIYKRFWKTLYGIAYSRTGDAYAAEDILHDIFTSLWYNRHDLQVKQLQNYLAVSVKYLVLRRIRREDLQRRYDQYCRDASYAISDPASSLQYKMILSAVQAEVEKLPEKCRLVFKYSRELGMSSEEIASQMNISPNTAKNHLVRALKQIRDGLKGSFQILFFLF